MDSILLFFFGSVRFVQPPTLYETRSNSHSPKIIQSLRAAILETRVIYRFVFIVSLSPFLQNFTVQSFSREPNADTDTPIPAELTNIFVK